MEQLLKQGTDFLNTYKRVFMILGTFMFFYILLPEVIDAQGGIKITSLSEIESKAKEGSDTTLNIAKYILGTVLGVALVFVIYALSTNNPHGKDFLIGWIVSVVVILVAFMII